MKTENLRQIKYNFETDIGEQVIQRNRYIFFILNEPTEINRIKQRILNELKPADDYTHLSDNSIPHTKGLNYLAFSVSSDKPDLTNEEKQKIYQTSKFTKDRKLKDEMLNPDIWFEEVYLPYILGKKVSNR